MFCRDCGKEMDENSEACPECGTLALEGNKFCNSCGSDTRPEAEFCRRCGVRLAVDVLTEEHEHTPIEGGLIEETEEKEVAAPEVPSEEPVTPAIGGSKGATSEKSRLAVTLFALLLGTVGVHRFYLEKLNTAVISLVLGVLGWISLLMILISGVSESTNIWMAFGFIALVFVFVWSLIDFVLAIAGITRDKGGRPVKRW
jgi:TM2 domain-containing membrane protein YozV